MLKIAYTTGLLFLIQSFGYGYVTVVEIPAVSTREEVISKEFSEPGIVQERKKIKKMVKKLEPGLPVLREAVAAVYRAAFGRLERDFGFFSTV